LSFLKQFAINYANLNPGEYSFEFIIDERFFEKFNESEIKKGRLDTKILLQKYDRILSFNFIIKGKVNLVCDRCLDNFDFNIDTENKLIVKFNSVRKEESDEMITIPESDNEINIAQFIYEFIHLALPLKRVHPTDKNGKTLCNKDIITKLEEHKNKKSTDDETDPRWEALKKIKFN
jgi:uncharacterized protein